MKKLFIFLTSLVAVFSMMIVKGLSADASIIGEEKPTKEICFKVDFGGNGGGTASISNYQQTTTTSVSSYNGVSISDLKDIRSKSWRVGVIGHWYQFTVKSFKRVEGIYSFFPAINKSLLESGDATFVYEQHFSASNYTKKTISFNQSFDSKIETKFYASIDQSYADSHKIEGQLTSKEASNCSYNYEYNYNREVLKEEEYAYEFHLSQNSVKYCPDGYNIAIGQIGTYYIGTLEYAEYKNWWGTDYICSDVKTINFVIASPEKMSYNYVIYKGANSEGPYYYYVG